MAVHSPAIVSCYTRVVGHGIGCCRGDRRTTRGGSRIGSAERLLNHNNVIQRRKEPEFQSTITEEYLHFIGETYPVHHHLLIICAESN